MAFLKFIILVAAASLTSAAVAPTPEAQGHPQYTFSYNVNEPLTGDFKTQEETRDGDQVHGSYSVVDPDGYLRTVNYRADDVTGFQVQSTRQLIAGGNPVPDAKAYVPLSPVPIPSYSHSIPVAVEPVVAKIAPVPVKVIPVSDKSQIVPVVKTTSSVSQVKSPAVIPVNPAFNPYFNPYHPGYYPGAHPSLYTSNPGFYRHGAAAYPGIASGYPGFPSAYHNLAHGYQTNGVHPNFAYGRFAQPSYYH